MTHTETMTPNYEAYQKMLSTEEKDHIRVNSKSSSQLGVMLEARYSSQFHHPKHGPFATLSGFWNYISFENPDDRFRMATGKQLGEFNEDTAKNNKRRPNPDFSSLMREAIILKILANTKIIEAMVNSDLPFKSYFYKSETDEFVDTTEKEKWMFDIFCEVREYLKGNITLCELSKVKS